MTRWPHGLDAAVHDPEQPRCPSACPFNRVCPTRIQTGVRQLFADRKYTKPSDCGWWHKLGRLVKREFGAATPIPADADALDTLLRSQGATE